VRGIEILQRKPQTEKEVLKTLNYFQKKFASLKMFSTFAVPNETGVLQRMLKERINKDCNDQ
jgi:hypothetical protein